jgi:putative acyl-CoA dehydrogenase
MSGFYQQGPELTNPYEGDALLRAYLQRVLPSEMLQQIEPDLRAFGVRVIGDIRQMAQDAEAHEPRLVPYDPWGRRVDQIRVSSGWRGLDRVSAEEGLVAIGYERRFGALSRVYQFAKLYLFHPSSAVYSCPLAMTDGAARCIELFGDAQLREGAYRHLTSRDPEQFWTSGQWMTERSGGSDVGQSETIARGDPGAGFRLYGSKWFTSATTSQMAMTLARIEQPDGSMVPGSRGLSLFYLETHAADGGLNAIRVHRLKDKLGTRALPTAELTLDGTPARLVGQAGRGVPNISALFNVTRIYNAVCAIAAMRRGLALAIDYATRRRAFGRSLSEHRLHRETLARHQVELGAALQLAFRAAELMGRDECGEADDGERRELRLLTPLVKLFTAKQSVRAVSEVVESFGGAGYVEDTGIPQLLRDTQVLSIWEGTTNVLALDALRAIRRECALEPFLAAVERRATRADADPFASQAALIREAAQRLRRYAGEGCETLDLQAKARMLADGLARTYAASLLLEQARWAIETGGQHGPILLRRWCSAPLVDEQLEGAVDDAGTAALLGYPEV